MSLIKKSLLLSALLISSFTTVYAADYTIFGIVVDENNEPEAYATVRIFNDNDTIHAAALGVTADDGTFNQTLPAAGNYVLHISSVGKTPFSQDISLTSSAPSFDCGTVRLGVNSELLQEVEVVATKPLVSKEIDRIGYDVQADDDSRTATVQDILRKVPMVTVEADGTIKVRGSSDFKIYRNGRPSNSFTNNAKDIFAAIPASMIKKIEVITDPGAKEDAEGIGAILNIVTMENTSINGIMGNVRAGMMTHNTAPAGGAWLTGNIGNVTLSVHGGYFHQSPGLSRSATLIDYVYTDTHNRMRAEAENSGSGNVYFLGLDGSYELDSLNLFTLEFGGYSVNNKSDNSSLHQTFNPTGDLIMSYVTKGHSPKITYLDFNGNFNYQHLTHLKDEAITFSYAISNSNSKNLQTSTYSDTYNFPAPYSGISSDGRQHFTEHTFQLDWTRPINIHNKFSIGGKAILRRSHARNFTEYIDVDDTFDNFIHKTTVGAGYFDYRFNSGRISARAGLRYEYSRLAAQFLDKSSADFGSSLNDWVPNASVMYNFTDMSTIKLAYTTRINRPGITYLDPTVNLSPTSQSFGNPHLQSTRHNAIQLNYSLMKQKFSIDLTAAYNFANNTIVSQVTTDQSDFTTSTYANSGRLREFDFSAFGQWTITQKTSLMVNFSTGYSHQAIPIMGLRNHGWNVSTFARATQQLPWKLRLEGMMYFGTGDLESVYAHNTTCGRGIFHALSLQRNFLKEDRLTVKLVARNPFSNVREWRSSNTQGSYTGTSISRMYNARVFGIEIAYRFGSVHTSVKRTATSIVNDDLMGGSSAPSTGSSGMSE